MPRHQHVTTCLRGGGPVSKFCACQHCTLAVCSVCGAYEGGLTTDCPGEPTGFDKQQEVHETTLDFTDARGWHLGEPLQRRQPCFEGRPFPPEPPPTDPRAVVAPSIDWQRVDRALHLQHELAQRAIAWAIADRACDARSAAITRMQAETATMQDMQLDQQDQARLGQLEQALEQARDPFKTSCRRVEHCEEEWKQAARSLVDALEHDPAAAR